MIGREERKIKTLNREEKKRKIGSKKNMSSSKRERS